MLISLIFGSGILSFVLYSIMLIFFYYVIGCFFQSYTLFKVSNKYISIPIGFVFYQLITFALYSLIILFGLNLNSFKIIELFKEIIIIFALFFFFKIWMPSINNLFNNILRKIFTLIILIFNIIIWLVLQKYVFNDQSNLLINNNETLLFALNQMYIGKNNFFNFSSIPQVLVLQKYQTFYYWLISIISLISPFKDGYSILNPSSFYFIKYIFPLIIIIIITNLIFFIIIDLDKRMISYFVVFILSLIITSILSFIGPYNQLFYSMPSLIISLFLLNNYIYSRIPSDNIIILIFISSTTLLFFTQLSIILLAIIGMIAVIISIEKGGQSTRNASFYILMLFVVLMSFSLLYLIEGLNFAFSITYLIFIPLIFALIIIPLFSLLNLPSRRKELVLFEEKLKNKIFINLLVISLIFTFFSIAIGLINLNLLNLLKNFFFINGQEWYVGFSLYLLFIFILCFLLFIFKIRNKINLSLNIVLYLNLFFNPITISIFANIFAININLLITFVPSILIFVISGTNFLLKNIVINKVII